MMMIVDINNSESENDSNDNDNDITTMIKVPSDIVGSVETAYCLSTQYNIITKNIIFTTGTF